MFSLFVCLPSYQHVPEITHVLNIVLLLQDIVITFILAAVFGIAGILAAFMAVQWARLNDDTAIAATLTGLPTSDSEALTETRDVLAATAVSM